MNNSLIRIPPNILEGYVLEIFLAAGLASEQAELIAKHLVFANLRGVDSHGVSRVDIYTKRIENGTFNKNLEMEIIKDTPISSYIHAKNSSGIAVATKGMEIAMEKAEKVGIGLVGIKGSTHCGMLADYTIKAVENDLIGFATTNAPPNMAPWGGKEKYFGTNPFSYGIPSGKEINIVFDMATSLVAKGKIILAEKNKQKIPIGWAVTKEGTETTNPDDAYMVLPAGGYKGYGLAFLVEVLSGVLTGAAFTRQIGDLYKELEKAQNVGHFLLAMRADLFIDLNEFKTRMDQMIREIRNIPLAKSVERIYLPGEIEMEKTKEREVNGIPLTEEIIEELKKAGSRYGVTSTLL